MYSDDFKINSKALLERKENYQERITAMTDYISDTKSCRSVIIGNYFNDKKILPCGICDNCINNKNISLTAGEFKTISAKLLESLKTGAMMPAEVLCLFDTRQKQKVWTVVNYLVSEAILLTGEDGMIALK